MRSSARKIRAAKFWTAARPSWVWTLGWRGGHGSLLL